MKNNIEQIEELLNSYIDGELDERRSNEVKRLIDNDEQIRRLFNLLKNCKSLVNSAPAAAAPENLLGNITEQLERQALLEDTGVYSCKAGRRHLLLRRMMTAAAVVALILVLSVVVFDIFVPPSSRKQMIANTFGKKTKKQVLYERPFVDVKPVADKKVMPKYSPSVPLVTKLIFKTAAPIEIDTFVGKAIQSCGLFQMTTSIDRQTDSITYVLNCDKADLVKLMYELSFAWQKCKDVRLDIAAEQFGNYVRIDGVSAAQAIEICNSANYNQRMRMANDIAVINKIKSTNAVEKLYAGKSDISYDLLNPGKPALTSAEKAQNPKANALSDTASLTIIVVND